ncbi:MAG: metal-dependent transcriptional regulator [Thermoprotei archaeon]|nr:MAG: metal-dependent transcriptional regulator [Thermoprotei archaeon]
MTSLHNISSQTRNTIEDYLSTMYRLEEIYGIVRTSHLASELEVTYSTASKMLKKLHELGYVEWTRYGGAKLTDRGREIALGVLYKHRVSECFLYRVLGLDLYSTHVVAHSLEHVPSEVIRRIDSYLHYPVSCPHGNPVPGRGEEKRCGSNLAEISTVSVGKVFTVVRILGELTRALHELTRLGLVTGCVFSIRGVGRRFLELEIKSNGTCRLVKLPVEHARLLIVSEVRSP